MLAMARDINHIEIGEQAGMRKTGVLKRSRKKIETPGFDKVLLLTTTSHHRSHIRRQKLSFITV
jgi:hypothetical protein